MASDTIHPALLPVVWRVALAMGLTALVAYLVLATQYYATTAMLALATLALMFGVARLLLRKQSLAECLAANRAIARLESERKDAAEAHDHLQALLDTVSAALLVLAPDGRVTSANRAARLLVGHEGPCLADIAAIGPVAAQAVQSLVPGERRLVQIAGGRQMLASVGRFAGDGQSLRLISLQAVMGELDAVQLQAWEDMSRVLTHEIMNSLTPIASLSESLSGMIRKDGVSLESLEAADTIARRSQGLVAFVSRYRQMAEMPEPQRQDIPLTNFASEIRSLMKDQLNGVAYSDRIEAPSLSADPDLLSQAVINLLHNAAEAVAGVSDPAITLTCSQQDGAVVVSVSDNGEGVPEQHQDEIFVPFFTTKPGGSGIGLGIVRQIALKHGGSVELRPNEPRGTIASIILPSR
jgi:two-component system nitrogen regulation sensor histidine kinase NtrY